jgi:hypothetical protein
MEPKPASICGIQQLLGQMISACHSSGSLQVPRTATTSIPLKLDGRSDLKWKHNTSSIFRHACFLFAPGKEEHQRLWSLPSKVCYHFHCKLMIIFSIQHCRFTQLCMGIAILDSSSTGL